MINIQPKYLSLANLLDKRLFEIPEFQRAYSWTTRERDDLFNDIQRAHRGGDEAGHFMAAVVCLRHRIQRIGTDEYQTVQVVDGQQRLTTLIILLKALSLRLDTSQKEQKHLAATLTELLVKPHTDDLLLLQTNHDSSHHFANYLRKGTALQSNKAKTIADRELLKAIEECELFAKEWCNKNDDLEDLAALLKNRLYFLLHEIEDEKSVYTVFEVLNSRGLPVSRIDRLKSALMATAFESTNTNQKQLIHELHNIWRDIYSTIGLRLGMSTEALRFAATLRADNQQSRPLSEEDAADLLGNQASSPKNIRSTASWLLEVTKACDKLQANNRINAVTSISQARLLAVAITLRDDFEMREKDTLLDRWERVTFRIYGMCSYDSRTRVGDYVRLAWQIINDKLPAQAIDDEIIRIGKDFPIGESVECLCNDNCYDGWEQELRYFMFRYEEYLARQDGLNFSNEQWEKIWMVSPSQSIEHIWPQSQATDNARHRLGNLVLLPPRLNSKLKDMKPQEKSGAYEKTGLLIAGAVVDHIREAGRWNTRTIGARENALLKWALHEWAD